MFGLLAGCGAGADIDSVDNSNSTSSGGSAGDNNGTTLKNSDITITQPVDPKKEIPQVCGDGALSGDEVCDDGNTESGDGCSESCDEVEAGYRCARPGFACWVCGNGIFEKGESCDDGNQVDGDGCSADCSEVETGFSCPFPGEACLTCGDGKIELGETCDDGNLNDGDGCSATCQLEEGYLCRAAGESCEQCGDGVIGTFEQCDDGNQVAGDGCNGACLLEQGWDCSLSGQACTAARCGDGYQAGKELCDDGNALSGDGCDIRCEQEPGFVCIAGASCRRTVCGDKSVEGSEQCDDGNQAAKDGCSNFCKLEPGYFCPTPGQACEVTTCGDGQVEGLEQCDTGTPSSPGCDSNCMRNEAYDCSSPGEACTLTTCGDGVVEGSEQCDFSSTMPGCTNCHVDPLFECDSSGCSQIVEFIRIAKFPVPVREMQAVHYDPRTRSFVGYDATSGEGVEFCTNGTALSSRRSRHGIQGGLDGATYDPFTDTFLFVTRVPAVLYAVDRQGNKRQIALRNHRDNTSWIPGGVTVADNGDIYITDQCGGGTACGEGTNSPYNIHVYSRADFTIAIKGGTVPYVEPPPPEPSPEGTCTQACWETNNNAYIVGSKVQNAGGVYSCLVEGWCRGTNPAYEPGLGWAYASAWEKVTTTCDPDPVCGEIGSGPLPPETIRPQSTTEVVTDVAWLDTLFSIPGQGYVGIYDKAPGYKVALYDEELNRVLESPIGNNTELFVNGDPVDGQGAGRADGGESAQDGGYFLLCAEVGGSCQLFAQSCENNADCAQRLPGTACNLDAVVNGKGYCEVRAVARDDGYQVAFNSTSTFLDVMVNDTASADCTGAPPLVKGVEAGDQGGTLEVASGGSGINYQPANNFCGVETFVYEADLNGGITDTATVKVYVACECGNGIVEPGEQCEVGDANCDANCHWELRCGDGRVGPGEECDDGGTAAGDGCSPKCTFETLCGDGLKEGLEECDDGNGYNGDSCRTNCTIIRCGDGIVDAGEQCDSGGVGDCTAQCTTILR